MEWAAACAAAQGAAGAAVQGREGDGAFRERREIKSFHSFIT